MTVHICVCVCEYDCTCVHAVRYLKTFAVFNVREFVVFFLSVCLAWVRKQVPPVASWLLFCAVCCGKCFSGSFFLLVVRSVVAAAQLLPLLEVILL